MAIQIINQRLDLHEFKDYVEHYYFGTLPANKLVIHHTWRPTLEGWAGERTIQGLKNYYERKGWAAGPHVFVAEDGIWLFTPMRKDGIHAGSLNHRSVGIEVVGDYDRTVWSGRTKYHALGVIQVLQNKLGIPDSEIYFHRDVSGKSCPGHAIGKSWVLNELKKFRVLPKLPESSPAMQAVRSFSAPIPENLQIKKEVLIPVWAVEAVAFIKQHQLFEIQGDQDVRDAVKFYRFYNLLKPDS